MTVYVGEGNTMVFQWEDLYELMPRRKQNQEKAHSDINL